jgi:lipopolysaccharide heptosyltransferase II
MMESKKFPGQGTRDADSSLAVDEHGPFSHANPFGYRVVDPQQKLDFRQMDLQRVLVMQLESIGNLIMLGPSLRALREALPNAKITLMASATGSQAAPLLPWIDDVVVSEALWQDVSVGARYNPEYELGLINEMRGRRFSAAFIFTSSSQSPFPAAYACYLAGIPYRLGFSRELGGGVLSHTPVPPVEEIHQAERNLSLLQAINVPVRDGRLEISIPGQVQARADQLLESVGVKPGTPFILLAPGARDRARRYDPNRFATVARLLSKESGIPLVITGSSEEAEDIRPVTQVAGERTLENVHSLVGRTTFPELAGITRRASLVITNNSGCLHIADAFQRPMVVLYSGTDLVSQWVPRSARARLLCRPVFCAPCHNLECPYMLECLDIRPDEVAIAALELLAERIYFRMPLKRAGVRI